MSFTITPAIPSYTALGPSDDDDFLIDFTAKLAGATIAALVGVTATPAGLTVIAPSVVAGPPPLSLAASGVAFGATAGTPAAPGAVGVSYTVSASIVTSDGRDLTRSAIVPVQPR